MFPDDENSTKALTTNTFNFFSEFTDHNEVEIKNFESKFIFQIPRTVRSREKYFNSKLKSKVIKFSDGTEEQRADPLHLELPQNKLKIFKFTTSILYSALVCLCASDIIRLFPRINKNSGIIESVFTYFSTLHRDTRHSFTMAKYFQIFLDVEQHGFRAATRLNGVMTHHCKNCAHIENNKLNGIDMVMDYTSPTNIRCQSCGGTEGSIRYLTVKHLKKKEGVVRKTYADFNQKMYNFQLHVLSILKILRSNDDIRRLLLEKFEFYQNLALKDMLLLREHYFIGHYDNTRDSKRRWCSLTIKQVKSLTS